MTAYPSPAPPRSSNTATTVVGCAVLLLSCLVLGGAMSSLGAGLFLVLVSVLGTMAFASGKIGPRKYAAIPGIFGACALLGTVAGVQTRSTAERQVAQAVATQRAQTAAAERHDAELRAGSAAAIARARDLVGQAHTALAGNRYPEAVGLAQQARAAVSELLGLRSPPAGAREVDADAQTVQADGQNVIATSAQLDDAEAAIAEDPGDDILAYDGRLGALATGLGAASDAARQRFAGRIDHALAAISRRRAHFARQIRRAQDALAEQQARLALCGSDPPMLGPIDGELVGSEEYLARGANDPDSIDVSDCTVPVLTDRECWVTTCDVRGRNAFGALVLNRYRFSVGRHLSILEARRLGF